MQFKVGIRVLDCFFFEGREIFFKVGLALLKSKERLILSTTDGNEVMKYLKMNDINCNDLMAVGL